MTEIRSFASREFLAWGGIFLPVFVATALALNAAGAHPVTALTAGFLLDICLDPIVDRLLEHYQDRIGEEVA